MDHVASTLGLNLPLTRARDVVMREGHWRTTSKRAFPSVPCRSSTVNNNPANKLHRQECILGDHGNSTSSNISSRRSSATGKEDDAILDSTVSLFPHRDSLVCLFNQCSTTLSGGLLKQFDTIVECCKDNEDNDDDTVTTATSSFDESSVSSAGIGSSSTGSGSVSFAEPLVTAVYVRPLTSATDKEDLFYTDVDYRYFRRDYFMAERKKRELMQRAGAAVRSLTEKEPTLPRSSTESSSGVKFSPGVVSSVWLYERPAEKDMLYYSEKDLQRFLDEFVASLNEAWP